MLPVTVRLFPPLLLLSEAVPTTSLTNTSDIS